MVGKVALVHDVAHPVEEPVPRHACTLGARCGASRLNLRRRATASRSVGAEEVLGDAPEVAAHRFHGAVGVPCPQCFDDRTVVSLVEVAALA